MHPKRQRRRGDRKARHDRARRVAAVLRQYEASPFQYEAACTHGLRAQLCLQGWDWHAAHDEARSLVKLALDLMGARRPPAYMAKPEYVLKEYGTFMERTRCLRCNRDLPEGHTKYCSHVCAQAHLAAMKRLKDMEDAHASKSVTAAAWAT